MKKWGFLLLFIVLLSLAFVIMELRIGSLTQIKMSDHDEDERVYDYENTRKLKVNKEEIYRGNLLLVNSKHPVKQEGVTADIINLFDHKELTKNYGLLNSDILLAEDIAKRFSKMVAEANNDGVNNFLISSGFRHFEEQRLLYEEMGSSYALPAGHSEHNLGLSLDVGSTLRKMEIAPEGKWIENNAWKYGFILRYPKDKVEITGIEYEPWHIRYVGLPHSVMMKEKGYALEEYLDYLKEERRVSAEVNGIIYNVLYYPISRDSEIRIPESEHYELSGNNIDGIILTVY